MRELKDEFFAFLDEKREENLNEAAKLLDENRRDESNTLKAKANIYDIFKAIWGAALKLSSDEESFKTVLFERINTITTPWNKSLEIAKQHDDTAKVVIEEAKLKAVSEVKEKLASM